MKIVARYAAGTVIAWLLYPIQAVVACLVLVLLTLLTDSGLVDLEGAPLVLGMAAGGGAVLTFAVIMPAIAIGEALTRGDAWGSRRRVHAAALAFAAALGLAAAEFVLWLLVGEPFPLTAIVIYAAIAVFSLLPFIFAAMVTYRGAAVPPLARAVVRRLPSSRLLGVKRLGGAEPGGAPGGQQGADQGDEHPAQHQPA